MGTVTAGANATAAEYNDVVYLKNYLMNSNFDIWQRGTSVALADVTVAFQADRWGDYHNKDGGTLPTLTRSREALTTGAIPNSFYYSRLTTDGAGTSLGVASLGIHYQLIEHGTRFLCGASKTVTLTYYARSSVTSKKLGVYMRQGYGTGGSPTSIETLTGFNDTLSSSWVKYTHTFTTNTLVGKTFGTNNNDYLEVGFQYMWGTDSDDRVGASGAETYRGAGTTDIAQVQLTIGNTSMEYKPLTFAEELRACQRYYQKSFNYDTAPAQNTGITAGSLFLYSHATTEGVSGIFKVQMRTAPTITTYSTGQANNQWYDASNGQPRGVSTGNVSDKQFDAWSTTFSAGPYVNYLQWSADAELT